MINRNNTKEEEEKKEAKRDKNISCIALILVSFWLTVLMIDHLKNGRVIKWQWFSSFHLSKELLCWYMPEMDFYKDRII